MLGDAVFYLMEPVDGFNAGEGLPPLHAGDPDVRHQMGLSMAEALAKLGAVDHVASRPRRIRQARRIPGTASAALAFGAGVLQPVRKLPRAQIPGIEQVAAWLEQRRPTEWTPGIMHGDYHAANVMFSRTAPDVVAIVDWEMCTIGDPLLDLGWLLATWRQPDGSSVFSHALGGQDGLASTDELFERYAANTTRDLSHITWYTVLACFKLGIVIEGTLARACAGKAEKEVGDQLHAATVHLFERALTQIENAELNRSINRFDESLTAQARRTQRMVNTGSRGGGFVRHCSGRRKEALGHRDQHGHPDLTFPSRRPFQPRPLPSVGGYPPFRGGRRFRHRSLDHWEAQQWDEAMVHACSCRRDRQEAVSPAGGG